jgi:hypothetical protein
MANGLAHYVNVRIEEMSSMYYRVALVVNGCISNFRSCPNLKLPFAAGFSTFVLIQKWSKKSRLHKKA